MTSAAPSMTRRTWLKFAGTAAGLAFASGTVGWLNRDRLKWLQPSDIESRLRAHFDYLKLEIPSETMRQFASDYTRHYGRTERGGLYRYLGRKPASHYEARWDELATTFLLSTDFFLHGADESQPVRYVALYHPYASPCWNPISLHASAVHAHTDPET